MTVTSRAVLLAALAAVVTLVLPTPIGAMLLVVVVGTAVADAWSVRAVPDVDRRAPSALSRGVPSILSVTALQPRTRLTQGVESPTLHVEPGTSATPLEAVVLATRRGDHRLGPVHTYRTGPLGLGGWHHRVGGSHAITVYPDMPSAARLADEVRVGLFREEGRRARGPLGLGTELESIRDYQPDDDIRQVNWRATVRTGRPMSNTYRIEQDRDVICVLDCGRLLAAPVTRTDGTVVTRLDAAVDAVAAMAAVADELGDRIGVVAFSDRLLRRVDPRRDGGRVVVDAVHDLEPQPLDSDYELAMATVGSYKRAFVLVLTDVLDPAASAPLAQALTSARRHHEVAVATIRDPDTDRILTTRSTDEIDLSRTVAAAALDAMRRQALSTLERRGVVILDAEVERLSRRCVGAYLRAKRLARI